MVLGMVHKIREELNPTDDERVRKTWLGILRTKGEAQSCKAPLLIEDLRKMMTALPDTLTGHRDRAIILLGFAGAMRRSELAALDLGDLELTEEGFVVSIRRSKTELGTPFALVLQLSLRLPVWRSALFRNKLAKKVSRYSAPTFAMGILSGITREAR